MKIKENGNMEVQGTEVKKRAVTISVTAEQLKELAEERLRNLVIEQMEQSEGGLKGTMAIGIAKAIIRQQKLEM